MVNTDADNQYPSLYIPALVKPIVDGEADVTIGNRQTWKVKHFSPVKKFQWFGSSLVRKITNSDVVDTVSGFRAYSRDSLMKLNVKTRFSYVLDTIMQCSYKNMKMVSIEMTTNPPTRKSRLFKNMFQHMRKSGFNLVRIFVLYKPFLTFLILALIFMLPSLALLIRFLVFFFNGNGSGHIQSLIAASMMFISSVLLFSLGIITELIRYNRDLIEDNIYYTRQKLYD
jgi:hypothetical protein